MNGKCVVEGRPRSGSIQRLVLLLLRRGLCTAETGAGRGGGC
jgi:hypothetical protein